MTLHRGVWLSVVLGAALAFLVGCGDDDPGAPAPVPDTTAPSVASIVQVSASPTNAASVDFTVTFTEAVTGVDISDFGLFGTAIAGASVSNVAGAGSVYTVTVSGVSGDGTLRLDLMDDDSIQDLSANVLGGAGAQNFTTGQVSTIDNTAPGVSSIVRVGASPTNAASVDFTVTFDSAVTGVGTADFALTVAGVTANVASVTPVTTDVYTVTVDTIAGDGTLRLDVSDDDSILDLATNPLGGAGAGNGNFITGEVYAIDNTAPNVSTIVRVGASPTNAASVDFTVTFDSAVSGVNTSDFTAVQVTGTAAGNVAAVATVSADVYTVTVDSIAGDGTLRLDVADDDSITDAVGNPLGGTGAGNGNFITGQAYTIDRVAPTVTSTSPADTDIDVEVSSLIIVYFDEPMDAASVVLLDNISVYDATNAAAVVGTVTYSAIDDSATFTPAAPMQTSAVHDVTVTTNVTDVLGNAIAAPYGFSFTTSAAGDVTDPSVSSIVRASPDPTNAASVEFTVAFDEAVTGVNTSDFAVVQVSGTVTGNVASVAMVSASAYTVTVDTITGDGTLRLDLMDDDSIQDLSANALGGPGAGNGDFITGEVYAVDNTAPNALTIIRAGVSPTNAASVDFTVTFDSAVSGVNTSDFTAVQVSGTVAGNVASVTLVTALIYTVTVDTITGDGTLRLDLADDDSIIDAVGNPLGGAGAQNFTAGQVYAIDRVAPTVLNVTSTKPDGPYTVGEPIDVTVTFDENVFVAGGTPQLTLETGTFDAVVNYSGGNGTATLTFSYTVAAGHQSGDLDYELTDSLSAGAGTIRDALANDADLTLFTPGAPGSLGANNDIVIDTPPVVTGVSSSTGDGTYSLGQTVDIDVTFSENVFVAAGTPQLTLETGTSNAVVNLSGGSGTATLTFTYTVLLGHMSADLEYFATDALALNGATIQDSVALDADLTLPTLGGPGSLSFNQNIVIDTTPPSITNVTSTKPDGPYTIAEPIDLTVTFTKPVFVAVATPQLTLETGTSDAVVDLTGGSGTATLTFSYTVAATHTSSDLEYFATNSLALNGATIQDSVGIPADLTLPALGGPGSLSFNKNIEIDTTAPAQPVITSPANTDTIGTVPTVIGTAELFSSVEIFSSVNGTMGTTPADGSGDWSRASTISLSAGAHVLTAVATDAAGNSSAASVGVNVTVDVTAPFVVWSNPPPSQTDVPIVQTIVVQFNETMDVTSVENAFYLLPAPVNGFIFSWSQTAVTYDTVTVIPDAGDPVGLSNNDVLLGEDGGTAYNWGVVATATDLAGNPMVAAYNDDFTTRDTTVPTLVSVETGAADDILAGPVPDVNVQSGDTVVFTFSEDMDAYSGQIYLRGPDARIEVRMNGIPITSVAPAGGQVTYTTQWDHYLQPGDTVEVTGVVPAGYNTLGPVIPIALTNNTFTIVNAETALPVTSWGSALIVEGEGGSMAWTGLRELTLTLGMDLSAGSEYGLEIWGVRDVYNNGVWGDDDMEALLQVAQSSSVDTTDPYVLSTIPIQGDTGVDHRAPIIIIFSEPVDKTTLSGITVTGAGVTTADFELDYGGDEGIGGMQAVLEFLPLKAMPVNTAVTVNVPITVMDLAGNGLFPAASFTFTTAVTGDGNAPTISWTVPAEGDTNASSWGNGIWIAFEDSVTGQVEMLRESTIDDGDFLVMNDTTGQLSRGWSAGYDEGAIILSNQSGGLSEGETYTIYVGPNIADAAGTWMAGQESFSFRIAGAAENHTPRPQWQEIYGVTTPSFRALGIQLQVNDEDGTEVTATLTDNIGGGVNIVSNWTSDPNEWDSWGPGQWEWRHGPDGPPEQAEPNMTDITYPTSRIYLYDITLSDGTDSWTRTDIEAWVWTPAEAPRPVSVAGTAVSVTDPLLVTTPTPTFVWTADSANADLLEVAVLDWAMFAGGDGEPGMGVYFFVQTLHPSVSTMTIPVDQALPVGIYLWFVIQEKMGPGWHETIGEAWSSAIGPSMTAEPMFVYGPENLSIQGDEHAVGKIGIQMDPDSETYSGVSGFSGTYIFGEDPGGTPSDTLVAYDGVDAGGTPVTPGGEFYAYEDPVLVITDMSNGPPAPGKGYMGHTAAADLFMQVQGSDPGNLYLTVGSTRATGTFTATELDGTWSLVQADVRDDGAGNFARASCNYGSVDLVAAFPEDGTGTAAVSITSNDDTPQSFAIPYTVNPTTGEVILTIDDNGTPGDPSDDSYSAGYIGGGTNRDIIVLSGYSDADAPFFIVMARQADLVNALSVQGTYNWVNFWVEQDVSGFPFTFQYATSGWGTFTFDGTSVLDYTYAELSGDAGSGTGTYSVDGTAETISTDIGIELVAGPDANTIFGIQIGADESFVNVFIATKQP